jgi:NAD(P)-dependent dehydrogenase (short-subunit alcohol dehydrogenase family)
MAAPDTSTTALPRGRTMLITGTTGIAAATVRLAVERGWRVFALGIDDASGAALAESHPDVCFRRTDVTRADEVSAGVDACVATWSRIDALFNVVGISGRRFGDGPLHECSDEGWDVTFEHNTRSTFLVARAVLRHMLSQPAAPDRSRGAILNMASALAASPEPHHFATHAYAASKGAITALTRAMAAYYAESGIRVNAIAPGLVATPMSARAQGSAEVMATVRARQPLADGCISPDDVASTALFLLGQDSAQITGQVVTVDGGWSVR